MTVGPFSVARLPRIVFGEGAIGELSALIGPFGRNALLVTGKRSLRESPAFAPLMAGLRLTHARVDTTEVDGEPSPDLVDDAVRRFHGSGVDVVIAIGGGSVLDAGKAIAGLLPHGNSVLDHLEGVGRGVPYEGPALPFIAVPTTAGTGSEATKNAVLSRCGAGGFKKSFRHDCLVPRVAVVDPDLLAGCPPGLIAADGMDAITQLVESYTSSRSGPLTDVLALSGLEAAREGLFEWYDQADPSAGRSKMAYAALLSGITLAQTGLGAVHGLASPLGAMFPIPHGLVCGTLLAVATEVNVRALEQREPRHPALDKYARLGSLLTREGHGEAAGARRALVECLSGWTEKLSLPRLGDYGLQGGDVERVVAESRGSSMKTNPIVLTDEEVGEIVRRRA
jgi:alcohol dehydrogenase